MGDVPHVTIGELEVLTAEECRELLGSTPIGRLAFVSHGEPLVLPVTYGLDGEAIVFRTTTGSKLDLAEREAGARVAFEIDAFDPDTRKGWSVLVKGRLDPVLSLTEAARLDKLDLTAWADPLERRRWLRLAPDEITGRRIVHDRD